MTEAPDGMVERWTTDAIGCHKALTNAWARQLRAPWTVAEAARTIRVTEYWRELGYESFRVYAEKLFGPGKADFVIGLIDTFEVAQWCPRLGKLVRLGVVDPKRVTRARHLMTPANVASWIPLLMIIESDKDFAGAVRSYEEHSRTPTPGRRIFVPIWMEEAWWNKHWRPHDNGSEAAFDVLRRLVK